MKWLIVVVVLMFAPTSHASTAAIDGNQLLTKCHYLFADTSIDHASRMELIDTGFCAGYLSGVTDVEAMWKGVEGKGSKSAQYCMPLEVTNGQMLRIIKKWLDDNPSKLHERGDTIIHDALREAFPCK
jgi:Rap1a immunity proteins